MGDTIVKFALSQNNHINFLQNLFLNQGFLKTEPKYKLY